MSASHGHDRDGEHRCDDDRRHEHGHDHDDQGHEHEDRGHDHEDHKHADGIRGLASVFAGTAMTRPTRWVPRWRRATKDLL